MRKASNKIVKARANRVYDRLREARVECGLTLRDVQAEIGVHKANLSRIENHQTNAGVLLVERLCDLYGYSMGEAFGGPSGGAVHCFGPTLSKMLKKSGLSFRDASPKMGVDSSYLNMLANGVRDPSVETVIRIAYCLGVEPCTLFG